MALARVKNWTAEVLTYSDLNAEFNSILNNVSSLICPITFHLTFTDATYDIGASGATRPRDFFLSRNATIGGTVLTSDTMRVLKDTAIPAGGTAGAGYSFSSTTNFGVFFGSGAPTLAAAKGSLYLRSDGTTTNNRAYINTDGAGTWTALTTAG